MTEAERWSRVLQAHHDEHISMRERGLARMAIVGRPRGMGATVQMPEPFSPYSLHQVNLSPYRGLGGWADLPPEKKTQYATMGAAAVFIVGMAYFFLK